MQHVHPHLIRQCLGRPHPSPQTTAQSVHALSYNYAIKSPLVTMGRPKFTPKTAPSPSTITTLHLIHPSLNQPYSPSQTASGSTQPFCHSTLSGQTDRSTHRLTDRIGDRSVRTALTVAILIESDVLIIQQWSFDTCISYQQFGHTEPRQWNISRFQFREQVFC